MGERDELSEWSAAWRATNGIAADTRAEIARRVQGARRRWLAGTVVEALIAVVGLAVTVHTGLNAERLVEQVAMASLSVVIVLAAIAGWHVRRSTYPPSHASSPHEWVTFLIARARMRLRMARAGFLLLAVETAIFVPWVASRAERGNPADYARGFLALAAIAAVLGVSLWLSRRRACQELDRLSDLGRDLD
jgi:uncharacterized protein YjiS (DUF1127 family)